MITYNRIKQVKGSKKWRNQTKTKPKTMSVRENYY